MGLSKIKTCFAFDLAGQQINWFEKISLVEGIYDYTYFIIRPYALMLMEKQDLKYTWIILSMLN